MVHPVPNSNPDKFWVIHMIITLTIFFSKMSRRKRSEEFSDTFYYSKHQYIDNDDTETIQEIEAEETEAEEIETEDIELEDQEKNKQIEDIEDISTLNILDDSDKKGSLVWNHFDKFADKNGIL